MSALPTINPEALVLAIADHIDGWKSATYGWQGHPDPAIEAQNRAAATQGHAAECIRRIRLTLAPVVMVCPSLDECEHGSPLYCMKNGCRNTASE